MAILSGYRAALEYLDDTFRNADHAELSDRQLSNWFTSGKVAIALLDGVPQFSSENLTQVVRRHVESGGKARTIFRCVAFRDGALLVDGELINTWQVAESCQLTKRDASRSMHAYGVPRELIGREYYVPRADAEALAQCIAEAH